MYKADLHTHSTFSDGTLSPTQLVAAARTAGLKCLALTDHDTVEGVGELLAAGERYSFQTIGGTELSLNFKGTTHMLGYRLGEAPPLDLSILQKHRDDRNRKMHKKLVDLGLDVEWERIQAIAGEGQVGKPHLARALLQKGYVETIKEAFTKYLGKGMPAYVEKKRLTAVEGIRLLLDSGHAPVLAHPVSLGIGSSEYEPCLTFLKENGLVGLEVYHPDNDHHHTLLFKYLALKLGLVATNGSDFHGANKRTPLTWVLENSPLTLTVVGRLEEGLGETLRRLGLK